MYTLMRGLFKPIGMIFYRLKVVGRENIPPAGAAILAANHGSIKDPVFVAVAVKRKINFLGKDQLFKTKISKWFFDSLGVLPVKRDNNDIAVLRASLRALKQESLLGIFPQGTRVDKGEASQAKTGVALLAVKSHCPIIPITIDATYRLFGRNRLIIHKPYYPSADKSYEEISDEVMKIIENGDRI
ncbi:MAG: lysophospholipid acyltransferase family protein [Filifactor alocis]|nr:lysophospholipid acyltransferase family protein [Filifactor alocis]